MKKLNSWIVSIHATLKEYGISQRELAQKLGMSEQWVSDVLCGKRGAANSEAQFTAAIDELISEKN